MRILLAAKLHLSGQTTHLVELAGALRKLGHEVLVIALGRSLPRSVTIYGDALQRNGVHFKHAHDSREFLAVAGAFAPDVAHGHSSVAVPFLLELRAAHGVPAVFTCHGLGVPGRFPGVAEVDRCIAVGPNVARELAGYGITCAIIQNGVDTDRFRPGAKGKPLKVAYVGRIDETKRKGLGELIEAVGAIPGAELAVASNERPAGPKVTALGWVEDVAPLMAESHVVCGVGRAIREGMACGAIGLLLGAKYGGPITPERCERAPFPSFGAGEGTAPRAERIRTDIVRIAQDRGALERLSAWSRKFACRTFSLAAMTRAVIGVYEDAMGTWRP